MALDKNFNAPVKTPDQLSSGPTTMQIDFSKLEGELKLETGEPLVEFPFVVRVGSEEGEIMTDKSLANAGGATKNKWSGTHWLSDDAGKYLFEKLDPAYNYFVVVEELE